MSTQQSHVSPPSQNSTHLPRLHWRDSPGGRYCRSPIGLLERATCVVSVFSIPLINCRLQAHQHRHPDTFQLSHSSKTPPNRFPMCDNPIKSHFCSPRGGSRPRGLLSIRPPKFSCPSVLIYIYIVPARQRRASLGRGPSRCDLSSQSVS